MNVNRKRKVEDEDLGSLSQEELIDRIQQLSAHNNQLRNTIKKSNHQVDNGDTKRKGRAFDFSKCHTRKILLRFLYLGWDYQGFASQEGTVETIEHHLFAALKKTCLIEDRTTSDYHRCGRTDKGVSAHCQVISITIRSKLRPEEQFLEDCLENEIEYCKLLNRVLPEDIRMIAWMPLRNPLFSARFDCCARTYRYFFPRGTLEIQAMERGAQHLIGTHDFRNFCKMDVANGVITFIRSIDKVRIVDRSEGSTNGADMLFLEIRGKAFLWHQIRCIMAVLLLIGEGSEQPEVVQSLLDVEKNPLKPQYSMARDYPLNLFNVEYRDHSEEGDATEWIKEEIKWRHDTESGVVEDLQRMWTRYAVKAEMINSMIESIYEETQTPAATSYTRDLLEGVRAKKYIPLMDRQKCESLDHRIAHYVKKKRLVTKEEK